MHPFQKDLDGLRQSIGRSVLGKEGAIEWTLVALIGQGHLLIEDVPGVGKTTLAVSLARSIDGAFQRIQFTSDLLPSDVLGVTIFRPESNEFEFKPGPIFANVVLADEINRTTPKTQSALLEAMQDGRVTIERTTHDLPHPFMVLATQNPIEFHGTYPLPESQLDRFMMRIRMGYPAPEAEIRILESKGKRADDRTMAPVCTGNRILEIQRASQEVRVDPAISKYMVDIIGRTRNSRDLELGVSPRGAVSLFRAIQARAFLHGRDYVTPDDVKILATPVLAHRMIVSSRRSTLPNTEDNRGAADAILREILDSVEVPV